jgi:hypothetical protein
VPAIQYVRVRTAVHNGFHILLQKATAKGTSRIERSTMTVSGNPQAYL